MAEPTDDIERDDLDDDAPRGDGLDRFVVDIDGYEGPIDALLALARDQKVDLTQISILALADQYLAFVARARRANLELAADYLVMAAWLAYLKSRLLLPELGGADEPTGEELAAALAFQLQRLEAMQNAGQQLFGRAQLGRDFFRRGAPESFVADTRDIIEVELYDLLKAYGDQARRKGATALDIEANDIYSVEDALVRLRGLLGQSVTWESLWRFLPENLGTGVIARSALASTFAASLELVKEGKATIRQNGTFGPIYVRAVSAGADKDSRNDG